MLNCEYSLSKYNFLNNMLKKTYIVLAVIFFLINFITGNLIFAQKTGTGVIHQVDKNKPYGKIITNLPWEGVGFLVITSNEPSRFDITLYDKDLIKKFVGKIDKNLKSEPIANPGDELLSCQINRIWSFAFGKKYAYLIEYFQNIYYIHQIDLTGNIRTTTFDKFEENLALSVHYKVLEGDDLIMIQVGTDETPADIYLINSTTFKSKQIMLMASVVPKTQDYTNWRQWEINDSTINYFRIRQGKLDVAICNFKDSFQIHQFDVNSDSSKNIPIMAGDMIGNNGNRIFCAPFYYLNGRDKKSFKTNGGLFFLILDKNFKEIERKFIPLQNKFSDYSFHTSYFIKDFITDNVLIYLGSKKNGYSTYSWNYKMPVELDFKGFVKTNSDGSFKNYKYLLPNKFKPQINLIFEEGLPFSKVCEKYMAQHGFNDFVVTKNQGKPYAIFYNSEHNKTGFLKLD